MYALRRSVPNIRSNSRIIERLQHVNYLLSFLNNTEHLDDEYLSYMLFSSSEVFFFFLLDTIGN